MEAIEEICRITAKGQTTVPKAIRQALGVGFGGRIAFRVDGDAVTIRAVEDEMHEDPALRPFLDLLEKDLAMRPEVIKGFTPDFVARITALAEEIGEVDLDAPIEGEVSL